MSLEGGVRPCDAVDPGRRACPAHMDEMLRGTPVPFADALDEELADHQVTVGDLVDMEALWVRALDREDDPEDMEEGFQYEVWVGDEAQAHYGEDARLSLDESLGRQPGVEDVSWDDRETLRVSAHALCPEGVLAAVATALLDPGVRAPR